MPAGALPASSAVSIAASLAQTRLTRNDPVWRPLSRAIRAAAVPPAAGLRRAGSLGPPVVQGPLPAPAGRAAEFVAISGEVHEALVLDGDKSTAGAEKELQPSTEGVGGGLRERLSGRELGQAVWAFAQRRVMDGALFRFVSGAIQARTPCHPLFGFACRVIAAIPTLGLP